MIRHVVVTAAIVKNVGHVFHFVYLSVCLSVWRITGKVVDQLWWKFLEESKFMTSTIWLVFGDDPGYELLNELSPLKDVKNSKNFTYNSRSCRPIFMKFLMAGMFH